MDNSVTTQLNQQAKWKRYLFLLQLERSQFVHRSGTETWLALSQEKAPMPSTVLYAMAPPGSSIVNTTCVVYWNVGHLFVVLLGIRPQVEVDDCGVDAAGLSVPLVHQLAKTIFYQLHGPNRTASDLDLSPVSWTQHLPWLKNWEIIPYSLWTIASPTTGETRADTLLPHRCSVSASAPESIVVLRGRREPEGPCSLRTWWASPCQWCPPLLWPPSRPRNRPPGSALACRTRFSSPENQQRRSSTLAHRSLMRCWF